MVSRDRSSKLDISFSAMLVTKRQARAAGKMYRFQILTVDLFRESYEAGASAYVCFAVVAPA